MTDGIYRKSIPLSEYFRYEIVPFEPGTTVIPKGTVWKKGRKPLECDIIYMRDVAIKMRDGITLYADIFRPDTEEKVPVILNSTHYGKAIRDIAKPYGVDADQAEIYSAPGVKRADTSGLETHEGSDPGFWCAHGYAVVNLDERGCFNSEGNAYYLGPLNGLDNYDAIEWLAAQDWSNGKVTMTGNSWLAVAQWFAAAACPPHLACIAPWEGTSDFYRDEWMQGGIPNTPGFRFANTCKDGGMCEDMTANMLYHPLLDEYWQDRIPKVEDSHIPVYATASWSSRIHTRGTWRAWRAFGTDKKWIRVHALQEWADFYDPENQKDLLRFFDFYMKGIDNGWESTPKIRLSVLDPGGVDETNRVVESFPLPDQQLKELYLDASDMGLAWEKPQSEGSVSYCSCDNKGMVKFTHTFEEETEIIGYISAKLWVEAEGHNDLDLLVKVSKVDKDGNYLWHYPLPGNHSYIKGVGYSGPFGLQRASLRKLDPEKSTPNEPYHTFDTVEKLMPHEIVPVEVAIYPTSLRFHKGEKLEFSVAGYLYFPFPRCEHPVDLNHDGNLMFTCKPMNKPFTRTLIDNNGNHIIYTGGKYDSKLIIPVIPMK
ncbi:MAG: CocE/NonD family hydrolase [Lachnospiraceae bacterium]|jgi:predicted acyl esterase|nr:CocE/NonD family hydrolase [Lachnospiraceae bacterium]